MLRARCPLYHRDKEFLIFHYCHTKSQVLKMDARSVAEMFTAPGVLNCAFSKSSCEEAEQHCVLLPEPANHSTHVAVNAVWPRILFEHFHLLL